MPSLYTHDGSGFNRRDGTLTIARRLRKPFVAPFYEFDAVCQLQVTPHGGHDYVLWLPHRYTDTRVCLATKLQSLGLDKPNIMAVRDTLQRYMDVDQPLPDLPILEHSRHLDPLTLEHDKARNRPERRWRDTDVKAWQRKETSALRDKLVAYLWQSSHAFYRRGSTPVSPLRRTAVGKKPTGFMQRPRAMSSTLFTSLESAPEGLVAGVVNPFLLSYRW